MNYTLSNLAIFAPMVLLIALIFSIQPYLARKILFGVFVPEGVREHPAVKRLRTRFAASVWAAAVSIFAVNIAASFVWNSRPELIMTAALILQIGVFPFLFAAFRRAALRLKAEQHWERWDTPAAGKRVASLNFRRQRTTMGNGWYAVHFLAAAVFAGFAVAMWDRIPDTIATHFGLDGRPDTYSGKSVAVVFFLNFLQLFVTGLFMFVNYTIRISKQQLDPADPEKSMVKQLRFRRISSIFLWALSLVLIVLMGISQGFMLYGWPQQQMRTALIAFPLLLAASVIGFVLYLALKGYDAQPDAAIQEDHHWRGGGMFYYNPDDAAVFVAKRVGFGWTLNFARPASWWIMGGVFGAIALIVAIASLVS
jgi:uncharacterized membrane protein